MQLVELQQAQQRFKDQGIGLAAISYDSEAILKDFADRLHITFPLLADPQSEIIRKYGLLNPEAKGMQQGMAFPGYFYVDSSGRIKEKFFETAYTDRYTANNVIAKLFPELTEQLARKVEAAHIGVTLQQSDQITVPGSHVALIAEVSLGQDLHVYAPGVKGYIPIELKLEPAEEMKFDQSTYPQSKILFLEAIKERVPVFEGNFRITQDVTISADRTFIKSLAQGKTVTVKGNLKYQACDKRTCYMPATVPVSWEIQILPLDLKRSPEAIQHRPSP
jgi:peroxiredoxin